MNVIPFELFIYKVSVLCKIMDVLILSRERAQFCISEMQFGFRDNHSASLATFVVLETVDYYC